MFITIFVKSDDILNVTIENTIVDVFDISASQNGFASAAEMLPVAVGKYSERYPLATVREGLHLVNVFNGLDPSTKAIS